MKSILTFLFVLAVVSCSTPKIKNSGSDMSTGVAIKDSNTYPLAVSFNSICCGTASPDFLKTFVKQFNEKNSTNISADIAAGCGKEGEFVILFKLSPNDAMNAKFKSSLVTLVGTEDAKNKKLNSSSGGISLSENATESNFQHCRLGILPWKLS